MLFKCMMVTYLMISEIEAGSKAEPEVSLAGTGLGCLGGAQSSCSRRSLQPNSSPVLSSSRAETQELVERPEGLALMDLRTAPVCERDTRSERGQEIKPEI